MKKWQQEKLINELTVLRDYLRGEGNFVYLMVGNVIADSESIAQAIQVIRGLSGDWDTINTFD